MRSILVACLLVMAPAYSAPATIDALDAWQMVLNEYVDDQGRTDFARLAQDPKLLKTYVDYAATHGPESTPELFQDRNAVLAYHTNTYNALAMYGVIDTGLPTDFDSFWKRVRFFKLRKVTIDGKETNLYDYENKVIRPLNEPRIHFALNCMVRDCPRLLKAAYTRDNNDTLLEAATREFLNSSNHIQIDHDKKQIRVSAILDFYTEDFVASGKAKDLPNYINPYRELPLPAGYKVKYLKYDWTVNQAD